MNICFFFQNYFVETFQSIQKPYVRLHAQIYHHQTSVDNYNALHEYYFYEILKWASICGFYSFLAVSSYSIGIRQIFDENCYRNSVFFVNVHVKISSLNNYKTLLQFSRGDFPFIFNNLKIFQHSGYYAIQLPFQKFELLKYTLNITSHISIMKSTKIDLWIRNFVPMEIFFREYFSRTVCSNRDSK